MKPENMYKVLIINDKITRLKQDIETLQKLHDALNMFEHYYTVTVNHVDFHLNEYDMLELIDFKKSQIEQMTEDLEEL